MTQHLRPVADIATGQHGAVTAAQVAAAGMSSSELRRRVQSDALEPIGSHTFRSPFAPRSARADLAAVVLDCGPGAVASGPTAAALHGFDTEQPTDLHVLSPSASRLRSADGLKVHRRDGAPLTVVVATLVPSDTCRVMLTGPP